MKIASKLKFRGVRNIAETIDGLTRLKLTLQGMAKRGLGTIVLLSCLTGFHTHAATATLVKDINPIGDTQSFISNFGTFAHNFNHTEFTVVGETFYFAAVDGIHGGELWKSDGTEAGTTMVLDINPGSSDGFISDITALGSGVYFIADDGTHGRELWKSDGTAAGTTMVSDLNVGATGSAPASLTAVGDTLFWAADDGVNGVELWKTDGINTTLLADNPGQSSFPSSLISFSDKLYYARADGFGTTNELWVSDGTEIGTEFVKGLPAAPGETGFSRIITMRNVAAGFLYFAVEGSLWRTGGTTTTTEKVGNIDEPGNIVSINGNLIFTGKTNSTSRQLWRIFNDPNLPAPNLAIEPVDDGNPAQGPLASENLVRAGNQVFFAGASFIGSIRGLYSTDGTSGGTQLVQTFPNGTTFGSTVAKLTAFQDSVIFVIDAADHGSELWMYDGTNNEAVELANINTQPDIFSPGSDESSNPDWLTVIGDDVFFSADDGILGKELWKINITETPTNPEDSNFCVPVKAKNGNLALICL